jgi:hypothetical protein
MTRAFLLIAHGRPVEATAVHPLALPALAILAVMAVAGAGRIVLCRKGGGICKDS